MQALSDVTVDFHPGKVHVLFGENGAGKSTLINVLSGVYRPDSGAVLIGGRDVSIPSPQAARQMGVSAVFQEPALIPNLTVAENLTLGREIERFGFLQRGKQFERARTALERIGSKISLDTLVRNLSRADQQVVEIARALQGSARLLILDEPTASLTEQETERLFGILEQLRQEGIAMIYITHRMAEIRRIGDEVTVMRDGMLIKTTDIDAVNDTELVELMVGRKVEALFPDSTPKIRAGGVEFINVTSDELSDVSVNVRRGEIVGVTGLVGSGKEELGKLCFGLSRQHFGSILIDGKEAGTSNPEKRLSQGIIYYPSDRKRDGLVQVRPVFENVTLSALDIWSKLGGFLNRQGEYTKAEEILQTLSLRPFAPDALPVTFSGGNQQKIVLSRGFTQPYAVHVFDEPTTGVDVGARVEIYNAMHALAIAGAAVLVISSDLPEIVNLTHRAYVIARGQVVGEFSGETLTEENILPYFFLDPEAQKP